MVPRVETSWPLLLLDVDGVLNPYPECPEGYTEHFFFPEDDEPVRLAAAHGDWLRELSNAFTLVWASAWGENANVVLCAHFGLPTLPVITLPEAPFDPSEKVPPIDAFAGDRSTAWVDDLITPDARRWAQERIAPTLLVEIDHRVGLTRGNVDRLLSWPTARG
jgi:hypothetical protein